MNREETRENPIEVLPPDIANLIAAGEVVERPASVVKELVENAIDAGANSITVEIKEGGASYLRVTDTGKGIPSSQLETAFLRHATSKLQKAEHLSEIATLGFRGEALAAIAAVSKIQVTSCVEGETFAQLLQLEGGKKVCREETGGPVGTTILVEDLFFNTPARKKFMKTARGEGAAITSLLQEVALSHPEIAVKYIRDGKTELQTSGDGELKTAIFHVLGKSIALGMRDFSFSDLESKVEGFVCLPSCCRASRNFQHFFVNGRYIKSPLLCSALEEAYNNQKMVGKFPSAVIHLSINFKDVDVNVHPAKTQVKFAREQDVFRLVYHGVLRGLVAHKDIQKVVLPTNNTNYQGTSNDWNVREVGGSTAITTETEELPDISSNSPTDSPSSPEIKTEVSPPSGAVGEVHSSLYREVPSLSSMTALFGKTLGEKTEISVNPKEIQEQSERTKFPETVEEELEHSHSVTQSEATKKDEFQPAETVYQLKQHLFPELSPEDYSISTSQSAIFLQSGQRIDFKQSETDSSGEEKFEMEEFEEVAFDESLTMEVTHWRVVGEFFRTYVAVELGDEMFFIDKHAAHERMLFNQLKAENYRPMSQSVLKPIVVDLSPEEMACVSTYKDILQEFSFDFQEISNSSVVLEKAPYDIPLDKLEESLLELVGKLSSGDVLDPDATRDEVLHTIACKSAMKAGDYSFEEEQFAVAQLAMEDRVRHCPHGRPILASLSKKDLEKKFKRT